jgi:hypothetical protein
MQFSFEQLGTYFSGKKYPFESQLEVIKKRYLEYAKKSGFEPDLDNHKFYVIEVITGVDKDVSEICTALRHTGNHSKAHLQLTELKCFADIKDFATIPADIRNLGMQEEQGVMIYDYNNISSFYSQERKEHLVTVDSWAYFLVLFDTSFYNFLKVTAVQPHVEPYYDMEDYDIRTIGQETDVRFTFKFSDNDY